MKFKIGDWVVRDVSATPSKIVDIIGEDLTFEVHGNPIYSVSSPASQWKLWEPTIGDWCWFTYVDSHGHAHPAIAGKLIGSRVVAELTIYHVDGIAYGGYFNRCEPFINSLPSWLQNTP